MKRDRVISFIDGFNLYHAIANLKTPHLKWIDLFLLSRQFVKPVSEQLKKVFYPWTRENPAVQGWDESRLVLKFFAC